MPLRLLSLLLVVNFSTLFAGSTLAAEAASTPLRGPKSSDVTLMQRQLGPLSAADTLWRIAERVKPKGANVSTYQVMYAIYLQNPDAFIDDNLNHLRPGATLVLPGLAEIRQVDVNLARAKSEADDQAWAERSKAVSQTAKPHSSVAVTPQTPSVPMQQLTELKDQFGNSLLMIEAIARENNQLKATLSQLQAELLALQQQLDEDSTLQQQLNTLLQQQADILEGQQAQEQQALQAAAAVKADATEQVPGPGFFNNPIGWVLAASFPALLVLFGVVLWLKRRGQQTEAAVLAANNAAVPPADYQSPLPPLDDINDFDDSGLFDIDESLLEGAFADHGDFTRTEVMDDSLPDFNEVRLLDKEDLLDSDILLDDDSLLAREERGTTTTEDDVADDALAVPDLADAPVRAEFDANNILSDSDLNALLSAEDDDDAIIELDEDELNADPFDETSADVEDEIVELDAAEQLKDSDPEQLATTWVNEADTDDLLEEIELDIADDSQLTEPAVAQPAQVTRPELDDEEHILVETDNTGEQLISEQRTSAQESSEQAESEWSQDDLTDTQIANLVEDESFDRTELDAFAEALALEGTEYDVASESADEQASELLNAELDELLQHVEATDTLNAGTEPAYIDAPDLQNKEDDSVTKPSEAALSVENPSKMLESYPELELADDHADDEPDLADYGPDDDAVSIEITPADQDADQSLAKLDESQFDNLLTELEAMAQTTASDSEELNLDVDPVFSPTLDNDDLVVLSDDDFVEIDKLLANSEQLQQDDGRFEQLNVDVGLDEFADVIGNDNPQDVDTEDNGFAAKLDLVRAYMEIDDQDSAGQIIAAILDSDAPEHVKTEAKTLKKP